MSAGAIPAADTRRVALLVARMRPILAGEHPVIQSAVLADLLAMWLAGHVGRDAERWRAKLLAEHIDLVRALVPVNELAIAERLETCSEMENACDQDEGA